MFYKESKKEREEVKKFFFLMFTIGISMMMTRIR